MIRVRTRWPHRVGGLTFWSPAMGYWRFNIARTSSIGEGSRMRKIGDHWMGPGRDRHITWWREKMDRGRRPPLTHG